MGRLVALLRANGTRTACGPGRMFSGVTTVAGGHRAENIAVPHTALNFSAGWASVSGQSDRASRPSGAQHPVAFAPARKTGGIASRSEASFSASLGSLNLAAGRNIAGDTALTWTVPDAQLQLIVSATGSVSVTFSTESNLAGSIAAQGAISFAFTSVDAVISAIADLIAATSITFTNGATPSAIGSLAGDITPFTELSPDSLASAVWSKIIESGYSATEILRLIASVNLGLVSGGPGNPVFRDIGDTKDRVTGVADSDGNRTAVTYDAT